VKKRTSPGGTAEVVPNSGGAQMDGSIELLTKLVIEAGIGRAHIYKDSLELPV
jgi:hypothetical protein